MMNDNLHINVNCKVLVWARETLALTRNQVTENTNISSKRLIQLETGEKLPTPEELKLLSKTYKRTIATLLLSNPPKELPLPSDRRTVDSKELGNFNEKTIVAVRKARALAKLYVELKEEFDAKIPEFKLSANLNESPHIYAKRIREILELNEVREIKDSGIALEFYIEKVESLGICVFQLSLTQDNLRGFSIVDDIIPIIAIKRGGELAHSKNFTLFHELGHILLNEGAFCDLNQTSNIEIEKWCNSFASEILIPQADLIQTQIVKYYKEQGIKQWAKQDLINLANIFHVGPLAMLRKLLDNGLTTKSFYLEKHKKWNKPPFGRAQNPEGRNIAKEALVEKGRTYVNLAFKAFDQNRIDIKDLSDYLGIKLSYIPKTRQMLNA